MARQLQQRWAPGGVVAKSVNKRIVYAKEGSWPGQLVRGTGFTVYTQMELEQKTAIPQSNNLDVTIGDHVAPVGLSTWVRSDVTWCLNHAPWIRSRPWWKGSSLSLILNPDIQISLFEQADVTVLRKRPSHLTTLTVNNARMVRWSTSDVSSVINTKCQRSLVWVYNRSID